MLIFYYSYCRAAYLHAINQLGDMGFFKFQGVVDWGILNGRIGQTEEEKPVAE